MATTGAAHSIPRKEIQISEWEQHAAVKHEDPTGQRVDAPVKSGGLKARLDAVFPPHRRYIGLSRKVFLIALLAAALALLALIIGLAAGLSGGSKHSKKNLPLPGNTDSHTGDLTYYQPGLGACGITSDSTDSIVSVSHIIFDAAGSSSSQGGNSNNNPLCGQMLRASRYDEEAGADRSVDLKVVDRCTGCEPGDLDTSLGVFTRLAAEASGRVDVTWAWLQPVATGT
ncbi:hypothetical protein LTR17_020862 [Elasticomyces elasticus]|nr:hypothetical protein LTR17_020862 [Elasticomyces elasticus]